MVNKTILTEKIKKAIKKTGLTQTAFENKYGISKNLISSWLHGKRNPSIKSLNKIATATKTPLEYFLEDDNSNTKKTIDAMNNNDITNIKLQLKDHEIKILKLEKEILEMKLKKRIEYLGKK